MSKSQGQHRRPRRTSSAVRRRDPPPVGGDGRLRGRPAGSARTILQTTVDAYRKLRNTVRYMLGALADMTTARRVAAGRDAAAGAVHPAPAVRTR